MNIFSKEEMDEIADLMYKIKGGKIIVDDMAGHLTTEKDSIRDDHEKRGLRIDHDKKILHLTAVAVDEGKSEIRMPVSLLAHRLLFDYDYTYVFYDKDGKEIDPDTKLRIVAVHAD